MQRVLIIGATSAIAEATARLYAAEGGRLFLVGRQEQRLVPIATDLNIRGASGVDIHVMDANDVEAHVSMADRAWASLGTVDVVLIAHGTLPDPALSRSSVSVALSEFATNATSTIALLTLLGERMEKEGHGTIAVISSVAGDRGRASNYLYGAAKAAVSTFASGLRQHLNRSGVNVLTIKPGFVDTPMTANFKKGPLWATAETVASSIVAAVASGKATIYCPGFWRPVMLVIKSIPEFIFRRIRL